MSVKITDMAAIGALTVSDLLEVVDDPAGTPLTRSATFQQVVDLVGSTLGVTGSANQVLTDDGDGTVTSEANMTFDGTTLKVGGATTVAPSTNADSIVIDEGAADSGLSIISTSAGRIYFGDAADADVGMIRYNHSDNSLDIVLNASLEYQFNGTNLDLGGNFLQGTSIVYLTGAASEYQLDKQGKAADGFLSFFGDATYWQGVDYHTGTAKRWRVAKNVTAETGSDAGSDFVIDRYNDAGTLQGSALSIARATGNITTEADLAVTGTLTHGGTTFDPASNDGSTLGQSGTAWSDLFLASGGVINWNAGDVAITHSTNVLEISGGDLYLDIANYADNYVIGISNPARTGDAAQIVYDGEGDFRGAWIFSVVNTAANVAATELFKISGVNDRMEASKPIVPKTDDLASLGVSTLGWSDLFLASGAVINFNAGDVTITHSANALTFSGGQFVANWSGDAGFPIKSINTSDNAAVTILRLEGDRATPAANDSLGVTYYMSNSVGTQTEMALQKVIASSVTSTSEEAYFDWGVTSAGALSSKLQLGGASLRPATNDGLALGTSSLAFSDLYLANAGIIYWNGASGAQLYDDASNNLIFSPVNGGYFRASNDTRWYYTATDFAPWANDGLPLGTSAKSWSDLFLASGAVVNFNAGDVTLTHGANTLTLDGGSLLVGTDSSFDIGSTGTRFANVYADEFHSPATTYTPTPTAQTGTLTGASSSMYYVEQGKWLHIAGNITVNDITTGSATGYCQFLLPNSLTAAVNGAFMLNEGTTGNKTMVAYFYAGQNYVRLFNADGTTFASPFIADTDVYFFSATIPTQ